MEESLEIVNPIESLFPGAEFHDFRRELLFAKMVRTIAASPGQSLPELFPRRAQYHSVLDLLEHQECQHDSVLGFHSEPLLERLRNSGQKTLIVHDSTLFDFSGHKTLEPELGPIGNGGGTGWTSHQSLAVDPHTRQVHGLLNQILHVQKKKPKSKTKKKKTKKKTKKTATKNNKTSDKTKAVETPKSERAESRDNPNRLSLLWPKGVESLGPKCELFLHVADRGADTFEFLQMLLLGGHRFTIRSAYNRTLVIDSGSENEVYLHDHMRAQESKGSWEIVVPAREGNPARVVELQGSSTRVKIRPPHNKKGIYKNEPVEINVARIWEEKPEGWKEGDPEPLEWILLTTEPVATLEDIKERGSEYGGRWVCEEYHKVQKSGLKVESYQLQNTGKLAGFIAILSVIAVALLNMRLAARDETKKTETAEKYVPKLWVELLSRYQFGKVREMTIAEFVVELARLGGYQKNPEKYPPGWITIWRGWRKLTEIIKTHQRLNST